MCFRSLLAAGILIIVPMAHALDTFTVFNLNALEAQGTITVSGTVTLDNTTGKFTNSNFTDSYDGFVFTGPPSVSGVNSGLYTYAGFGSYNADYFVFNIPQPSLIGYTGGQICSDANLCANNTVTSFLNAPQRLFGEADSGSLTLQAVTPEPPELALLGTGLLVVLEVARRRSQK